MRRVAVEAVRANLVAGQADGPDEGLQFGELQGMESKLVGDGVHHALVLGRVGDGISFDAFIVERRLFPLDVSDSASGDEFEHRLRFGEVDKRASEEQRRAGSTHVDLLGSSLQQTMHMVVELGASHNGIVA